MPKKDQPPQPPEVHSQPPPTTTTTTTTTTASSSSSSTTLEAQLARGLKLTEELSSPSPSPASPTTTPAKSMEAITGIAVLYEGDLQYANQDDDDNEAHTHTETNPDPGADADTDKKKVKTSHPRKCRLPSCSTTDATITATPLSTCSQCKTARYCSREHQVQDWKQGHKRECAQLKELAAHALVTEATGSADAGAVPSSSSSDADDAPPSTPPPPPPTSFFTPTKKKDISLKLICQIRLHLGPYTLAHYDKQGRGFAFVQSTSTAQELFLPRPINLKGEPLRRGILMHYLTWGEFVSVVLEDDFEYIVAKEPLQSALETYDPEKEYLVLLKLRCGFLTVLRVPLVPGAGPCRKLAEDYQWAEKGSVQLELD